VHRRFICGINSNNSNPAGIHSTVHPTMIATSLYNSIACLQVNVRIVEQHADLA
jgi:hypothetical protein